MTSPRNPIDIRLPTWLVVAIVLLLLAQTIQFGLLFALLKGDGGSLTSTATEPVIHVADMEPSTNRLELRDPAEVAAVLEAPDAFEEEELEDEARADTPAASTSQASSAPPAPRRVQQTSSITFEGTEGYLVGPSGKVAPGALPPGSYEVYLAQAQGSEPTLFESVTLSLGDEVLFRCGFGACRRIQ